MTKKTQNNYVKNSHNRHSIVMTTKTQYIITSASQTYNTCQSEYVINVKTMLDNVMTAQENISMKMTQ